MPRPYALPPTIGADLKALREQSLLNQKQLQRESGLDQSRISRIEKGEATPSDVDVNAYLSALRPALARRYKEYLRTEWRYLAQPPFSHPDLESLTRAERCLKEIDGAFPDEDARSPIRGQLQMYRDGLLRLGKFLESLEHVVAFIGPIAVGKSTAISHGSGLILPSKEGIMERCVLEVAGGRTTLCEVILSHTDGPRAGVMVEPQTEEELHVLVGDLCAGFMTGATADDDQRRGVPTETETVLRRMAGLARATSVGRDKKRITIDPLRELASTARSRGDLQAEVCTRMNLQRRTRTSLWFDGSNGTELEWLKRTFSDVNRGRLPDVPFPRQIKVLLPRKVLDLEFETIVVDTKGIENSQMVIRPDLDAHLTNPRSIALLCSGFGDMPDAVSQQVLAHLQNVGETAALRHRLIVLALPKHQQALEVMDDGVLVESKEHGYEVKARDASENLRRLDLEVPPFVFFNALDDASKILTGAINTQIRHLRDTHVDQINTIYENMKLLLADEEQARVFAAQAHVLQQLRIFCERHAVLPKRSRAAHVDIVKAMRATTHPTVLWASTRRRGRYNTFNVYFRLGASAAAAARERSTPLFAGLEEQVGQWKSDPELAGAIGLLDSLSSNLEFWRSRFIDACRRVGEETFRPALIDPSASADTLWSTTESFFGMGSGYRDKVADAFTSWFEDDAQEELHEALEVRVRDAWRTEVVESLYSLLQPDATAVPGVAV